MRVQCPNCSKVIPVTSKIAGRKAKCNCGTVLQIPQLSSAGSAMAAPTAAAPQAIEMVCESCQRRLSVPGSAAGKKVKCPCGVASAVPQAGAAPPPMPSNEPFGMPADDPFGMPAEDNPFAAPMDEYDQNRYSSPSGGDDYGMVTSAPAYMSAPAPKRKKTKRKKPSAPASGGPDMGQVLGGIGMMVGAVVWFVVGLMAGVIFFYPPILLIIGLVTMIKGFMSW